ncbi:MAG: hypothetical protein HYS98_00155 [Deltaproteobacteria bacterium]|nr:hypothetical protein [Deltaproteobacteria bacterium]
MKANTIKIEGKLLTEIQKAKPASLSFAAFVRLIIEKELLRRKMGVAAKLYQQFLEEDKEESAFLQEWEKADLANAPKERKK